MRTREESHLLETAVYLAVGGMLLVAPPYGYDPLSPSDPLLGLTFLSIIVIAMARGWKTAGLAILALLLSSSIWHASLPSPSSLMAAVASLVCALLCEHRQGREEAAMGELNTRKRELAAAASRLKIEHDSSAVFLSRKRLSSSSMITVLIGFARALCSHAAREKKLDLLARSIRSANDSIAVLTAHTCRGKVLISRRYGECPLEVETEDGSLETEEGLSALQQASPAIMTSLPGRYGKDLVLAVAIRTMEGAPQADAYLLAWKRGGRLKQDESRLIYDMASLLLCNVSGGTRK